MSKDTVQLPKTSFSMKANLPNKEPEIIKRWERNDLYKKIRKKSKGKEKFMFPAGIVTDYPLNGKLRSFIKKIRRIKMKFQLTYLEKSVGILQKNG